MTPSEKYSLLFALFFWVGAVASPGQTTDFQGQATAWGACASDASEIGIRYIPTLHGSKNVSAAHTVDAECALHALAYSAFSSRGDDSYESIKLYRLWMRLSTTQFEARAGLQKINFGSAVLLRPLMWFDRMDARDPLQLTDGVYGLLLRYYALNNFNVWLWGLYGNTGTRGWEIFPTTSREIEYGARAQFPMPKGEIALTTHMRQADASFLSSIKRTTPEQRLAIDGKWDFGVGCWLEGVLIHQELTLPGMAYQRMLNTGMDYTLPLGNGLHLLAEHLMMASGHTITSTSGTLHFSAVSLHYPLGMLDETTLLFYYDRENRAFYRFMRWQRTYDHWQFFLMGYWNPVRYTLYRKASSEKSFSGRGVQLMIVLNH